MDAKYTAWIEIHVEVDPYLQCAKYTELMAAAFPELTRVRGHVASFGGVCAHWWLVTATGEVVDPTASQFPKIFAYLPHDESQPEPIGKCRECGAYVYPSSPYAPDFCSEGHYRSYMAYLGCDPDTGRVTGPVRW